MIKKFMLVIVLVLLLSTGAQAALVVLDNEDLTMNWVAPEVGTLLPTAHTYYFSLASDTLVNISGSYELLGDFVSYFDENLSNDEQVFGYSTTASIDEVFSLTSGFHSITIGGFANEIGVSGYNLTLTAVPLPAAFWLFGSALIGFAAVSYRRRG